MIPLHATEPTPQPPDEEEKEEISDSELGFYHQACNRQQKTHFCPFANATQGTPCDRAKDFRRRDKVQMHLQQIILKGYDAFHPQDDPLWKTPLISQYYLQSCPPKLNTDKAKSQVSKYNSLYYRKKKKALQEQGAEMKRQYNLEQITAQRYKRFLIGNEKNIFAYTLAIDEAVACRMSELNHEGGATHDPEAVEQL